MPGADNVWTNPLNLCTAPLVLSRLVLVPLLPSSSSPDFEFPETDALQASKYVQDADRMENILFIEDCLFCDSNGAFWIPDADTDLNFRFCVIYHMGPNENGAATTASDVLRQNFVWSTLAANGETFFHSFIHCLSTVGAGKAPWKYGPSVHLTADNNLSQF